MIKEPGREHLVHRTFTFPEGYGMKTITMRELTGKDEKEAARQLSALGTTDDEELAILEANVSQSIVAIDGKLITGPFFGMGEWTMKVRRLVVAAFTELNSIPAEDADSFLNAGNTAPVTASEAEVLTEEDLE